MSFESFYVDMIGRDKKTLSGFVGPAECLICGDTLKLKDYVKTD